MKREFTIGIVIGGIVIGMILSVVIAVVVAFFQLAPSNQDESLTVTEATSIPTTEIIVALQPIAQGSDFVQGSVGRTPWPAHIVPHDIIADEAELLGKIAKADMVQGQPIVRRLLTDKSNLVNAPQIFAWCDVKDSATLVYSFSAEAGVEEPNIVLGSSGVVRLQDVEEENQAHISCGRNGFGQVTVNFVDPEATAEDMILYSCTLPLECQDGAVAVTTYSPPETK